MGPPFDLVRSRRRLVVVVAGFAVLAALALLANSALLRVDAPLSEELRGAVLYNLFREITPLGATETAVVAALIVGAVSWRRCPRFAVVYAVTLAIGALLNVVLKVTVNRPRPPNPDPGVALASFPSGHTFQATLVLGLLPIGIMLLTRNRSLTRLSAVVAGVGIVAMAISRVYIGAHWPTDVIAGALIGGALIEGARHVLARGHEAGTCSCEVSPAVD
jgi:membrane-associated phospholipid phosphatase